MSEATDPHSTERASERLPDDGRTALQALAPLLGTLTAGGVTASELARRLAHALATTLGWTAEILPGVEVEPTAPGGVEVSDSAALVSIAPEAGALRIRPPAGTEPQHLRAVAALAARALWSTHAGVPELLDANRRLRELGIRKDALVGAAAAQLRAAASALGASPDPHGEARRLVHLADELERAARPAAEPRAIARPRVAPGTRARVLVVDDEPDTREALAMLLEPDYEVFDAADGEAGVEKAHEEHPDVVLMDLLMPRMDGFQALERLRSDPATSDIPVLFVSGRGDDAIKVRSLDLGAVDFLQKPFSERELRARVERTLRLVRSQTQLRELAQTDPLTGLANLRAFRARIEEEVKRARRYHTQLTCVMADMDNLKPVNDQLGHTAGDRAIAAVAGVIREELRETDFGARYGGDEFVVLLPHTGAEEGRIFAERVCTRLHETVVEISGRRLPLGASFGVACFTEGGGEDAAEMLVREADAALYVAKRGGRGRVAVAPPHGDAEARVS